ncbi:hypothetical protein ABW19_dt0205705 [Dactylella cylindrospora]|nr:hypothetical protein ABW19_dt0205705 [Dactylella cylindrospora]
MSTRAESDPFALAAAAKAAEMHTSTSTSSVISRNAIQPPPTSSAEPQQHQQEQHNCTATGHHHHHHLPFQHHGLGEDGHDGHHHHHHIKPAKRLGGVEDDYEDEEDAALDSLPIGDVESIISPSISRSQSNFRHTTLDSVPPPLPNINAKPKDDSADKDQSAPKKIFFASQGKTPGLGAFSHQKFFRPRSSSVGNNDQPGKTHGDSDKWMSKLPSFNLPSIQIQLPSFGSVGLGNKDGSDKEKPATRGKRAGSIIDSFKAAAGISNNSTTTGSSSSLVSNTLGLKKQPSPTPSASRYPTITRDFAIDSVQETTTNDQLNPPGLRRSNSDSSSLRRTVSRTSSIGSDTRFLDVREQTNARYKAIKDSILPDIKDSFTFNTPAIVKRATLGNITVSSPPIDPLDRLSGDVVIMGGYRGSILKKVKPSLTHHGEKRIGKTLWIPMKVGFNLQNVDLEVPLDPEAELLMEDKVKATDMLSHIAGVDISRRLIKKLRSNSKVRLHVFSYDWRLSPRLASEKLVAFMANLPCNRSPTPKSGRPGSISDLWNDDGPFVIAHSLGGLITRHAVNQRPDLFRCGGILYAGVPQRCINVLGPLRHGDSVAFNKNVLNAQANFSFRSTFVFLPDEGGVFVDKKTGEDLTIDLYDPAIWQEYNLSPCVSLNNTATSTGLLSTATGAMADVNTRKQATRDEAPPSGPSNLAAPVPDTADPGSIGALANEVQDVAATGAGTMAPNMNQNSNASAQGSCTLPLEVTMPYLKRTLNETKKFREELAFKPSHHEHYPPFAVLYSKTTPTVKAAKVNGLEGIKTSNYNDLLFGAGDGVVLAREAQLPPGYICEKRVHCDRGHIGLLGDLDAVGQCITALLDARERNKKRLLRTLGRNAPPSA